MITGMVIGFLQQIKVVVPGYFTHLPGELRTDEIFSFFQELKKMYTTLSGVAELNSLEGLINLKAEINNLGQIHWRGETTYPIGNGSTLTFQMYNNQSFLPSTISELQLILQQFPVIGK